MLYLIGLGLNEKSISLEALEILKKCRKIYLEYYTVDFPYSIESLERSIGFKIEIIKREKVESDFLVKEAKTKNTALLIYGSPLFATTHLTLLLDCKKEGVKTSIICNSSIFDALGETGLELYKFGRITSMPKWTSDGKYEPDSFLEIVKENISIKAHSLILCDIGLKFSEALEQLEKSLSKKKMKVERIIACSSMGSEKRKIAYNNLTNLKKEKIENPFCFIIPGELHFMEKEYLESL